MICEHNYYSIILKGCSRRENLRRHLETVLLRGRLAIKMAIDQMPSVIIYKGKVNGMLDVLQVFTAEKAAITITTDGIPISLPLEKIYPHFSKLSEKLQSLLTDVPNNLWLGETIHTIVPANFLDEDGALVISSHSVYFIDKPDGDKDCRWLIIPYTQMTGSPATPREGSLSIDYSDPNGCQTTLFTMPVESLQACKASIHKAKAAKRYLIKLKTSCNGCGYMSEDFSDDAPREDLCHCGQLYERTIIA
ncbi:hypothetical protein [Sporomusa sp.]|uniref:hypothetical protein n=1 Tax=Sporomusa sp. TaxID=2078658 RepID=UPI002C476CC9|nr:hypothetical protein [Sporomusa sp.]HWR10177.1 hypothetical protein [Sporomusa sp.]